MKRNYFNEVKNILRKYDNSTTHRIFYGYTLFNVAHFALLFVFLLAFHDVIHSLNRGKLLEISNEFITPVTILLGFVIGFLQFAKTHERHRELGGDHGEQHGPFSGTKRSIHKRYRGPARWPVAGLAVQSSSTRANWRWSAPQLGQCHSGGRASPGVPGLMSPLGSPWAGS